jgi:hypothetical protein
MTKEEYGLFISGLLKTIEEKEIVQKDLAMKAQVSEVNLSKVLNLKVGSSPKWRKKICVALGVSEDEMIAAGYAIKNKPQTQPPQRHRRSTDPSTPAADVVAAVTLLASQFLQTERNLIFWQTFFESISSAACIIKDGIVLYQNQADRSLCRGIIIGEKICDSCSGDKCFQSNCADCSIKHTMETGEPKKFYANIGDGFYRVESVPMRADGKLYVIAIACKEEEYRKALEKLASLEKERKYIPNMGLFAPTLYVNAEHKIKFLTEEFSRTLHLPSDNLKTFDDFLDMLNEKLFSPKKLYALAKEARDEGIASEASAKLTNGKSVWFIFRPAKDDNGILVGLIIHVMDQEMYEFFKGRGAI